MNNAASVCYAKAFDIRHETQVVSHVGAFLRGSSPAEKDNDRPLVGSCVLVVHVPLSAIFLRR